ncbi:hypothetical protein DNH61_24615 [Paenibacillus sambharensis]|uniref:Carbohydrate ABC transporter substrate-binding protein n=1 Tax=Paenibacillus sambharensis TaxID=1803190 RepID=A0A2W1LN59_9BACL|nr:hypothetical protein DNH61_24615 [Paenibacillus sambharensis]
MCSLVRTPLIIIAICLLALTGCAAESPDLREEEVSLTIGYTSEELFEQRYASLLSIEYPRLKYTVVPMNEMAKKQISAEQWSKENSADLLYIPADDYQEFIDSSLLLELDTYIQRDSYPLETLAASVVDLTKQYGKGKLYGLPSNFYSRAIAYNKQLFDDMGIDYPSDQMTWDELIALASRFDRGLSLAYPSAADWVMDMGRLQNLQVWDETADSPTLHSPEWEAVFNLIREPLKDGRIAVHTINSSGTNPFISGEYAMQAVSYEEFRMLEQQSGMEWGLVTMPVNSADPDNGSSMTAGGFFAIPAASVHADAAWELLQYFMSDRVAELEYRSSYGFSILTSMISMSEAEDAYMEAFYKLGSAPGTEESTKAYAIVEEVVTRLIQEDTATEIILSEAGQELAGSRP